MNSPLHDAQWGVPSIVTGRICAPHSWHSQNGAGSGIIAKIKRGVLWGDRSSIRDWNVS